MTQPQRVEHQSTDKGSVPIYTTAIVEQPWDNYSATDHEVWRTLFRRQREMLQGRACREFLDSQDEMGMSEAQIPKFSELNALLEAKTGWTLIGVQGLLPELDFFEHLANRRFPVTWWIRRPEQLDYLSEPDLFHDLFGHVPLLMNPIFADYMQAYGKGGESRYCLDSDAPNRLGFDLLRVMRTRYRIDTFQKTYFVIDSFEQLMSATLPDFVPYYDRLESLETIPAGTVLDTDLVITRGTGEGWATDADF
jgi:phenylalanine-4-hydroxylase